MLQAQPKVRTNDGNLHLQGASVVIDTPGSTVRLPSALDALANQANATRTELATQLSAVNAEIRVSREAERRQAGSISNAVAAIASSTETLGGLIEETSAATLSTIIEASANHSTSVSEIEAAVANQCGGASFVRADPANATASSAMTVWGRDFIPAASGLYQCKFLLAHNSRKSRLKDAMRMHADRSPPPVPLQSSQKNPKTAKPCIMSCFNSRISCFN